MTNTSREAAACWGARASIAGFALYAACAPHSIAGAWIGLSLAISGWLARTLATGRMGVRRTALDLPLWLLFGWSVLSAALSAEPRISLAKLASVATFLIYYPVQAVITRRSARALAVLLITSGAAGALWGTIEVGRGRGVVIASFAPNSPLQAGSPPLQVGDCVWRVNQRRVGTVTEVDEAIRRVPVGSRLLFSVITRGEHVEWPGPPVTPELLAASAPSGIVGAGRTHRFRASGWTRHYETFAEVMQILAQLALGLALAHWQRRRTSVTPHGDPDGAGAHNTHTAFASGINAASLTSFLGRRRGAFYATVFALLTVGLALTAMRTVLCAFAVGALVVAGRARLASGASMRAGLTRGTHFGLCLVVVSVLALGAFAVWRTRAVGALWFQDDSARLRLEVARVALARLPLHPVFGHGMDAVQRHWAEWGFPGTEMIHLHSTPLQLAFDRGLPAVGLWLWLLAAFARLLMRAEKQWRTRNRDDDDKSAATHGLYLGTLGALAGLFTSSLFNYNFGDAEVTLLLWWLMGVAVAAQATKGQGEGAGQTGRR